jgi:WXG100 family type VII secretion target
MAIVGLDVGAVEQLGHNLKSQAEAIQSVINAVNSLVQHSQEIWKGSDATEFHGWWEQQHRPALDHVRQAVEGLGQSALNNASQQAEASRH